MVLGGLATDFFGWEWVFSGNVPIGAAGISLSYVILPEFRDPSAPPDAQALVAGYRLAFFAAAGVAFPGVLSAVSVARQNKA